MRFVCFQRLAWNIDVDIYIVKCIKLIRWSGGIAYYCIQRIAIKECVFSNTHHAGWDGNGGQGVAVPECIIANALHTIADRQLSQRHTSFESPIANGQYATRYRNGGEGTAILESIISNMFYTVGDSDGCQRVAVIKRIVVNMRHLEGLAILVGHSF